MSLHFLGIRDFPTLHTQFSSPQTAARTPSLSRETTLHSSGILASAMEDSEDLSQDSKDVLIQRLQDLALRLMETETEHLKNEDVTALHVDVDRMEHVLLHYQSPHPQHQNQNQQQQRITTPRSRPSSGLGISLSHSYSHSHGEDIFWAHHHHPLVSPGPPPLPPLKSISPPPITDISPSHLSNIHSLSHTPSPAPSQLLPPAPLSPHPIQQQQQQQQQQNQSPPAPDLDPTPPHTPTKITRADITETKRAALLATEAEALFERLLMTVQEFQKRKEESDHINDLLLTRAEQAAQNILHLQAQNETLEKALNTTQSDLSILRIQLRALEVQGGQYMAFAADEELNESIRQWKSEWKAVDARTRTVGGRFVGRGGMGNGKG